MAIYKTNTAQAKIIHFYKTTKSHLLLQTNVSLLMLRSKILNTHL